jgi:hypothetical protein
MAEVAVRLVGGLGNQMFQYAAARSVAIRTGANLRLDLSWFGTDPNRTYALAPFQIQAETYGERSDTQRKSSLTALLQRIKCYVIQGDQALPKYTEKSFRFDRALETIKAPIYLEGYFQSEIYFKSISKNIVDEFSVRDIPRPQTQELLNEIKSSESICVHIRRGDYVGNSKANEYHGTCSMGYYAQGINAVASRLNTPHCFVFSDEPEWTHRNFESEFPFSVVDIHGPNDAHEDLRLMSACQHFVIANSSLSWWGAWLGKSADKQVIAPKKWFKKDGVDTNDLLPKNWIRL